MQKKFPVSESCFDQLVRKEDGEYVNYFVDKTLFIREVLENTRKVTLITRPRRFGKSTNFDMLACFLDIRKKEEYANLFEGLNIESAHLSNGKPCMDYQAKYPVIYMNFKVLGQNSYDEFYGTFKILISNLYKEHRYLLQNEKLDEDEKAYFEDIIWKRLDEKEYKFSLKNIINYLRRHFDERVYVLIDEYDTPFQHAIHQRLKSKPSAEDINYFESLKTLMGTFLGDALKDNRDLESCVMTGIIRIAGAGIFSQLNNVNVWTVLDKPFAEYFGFTQQELDQLLVETGQTVNTKLFSDWYNGYEFGGQIIYNPLSVIKSLDRGYFSSYWLDTSNNTLIRDSLLKPRDEANRLEINNAVASWVSGKSIEKNISEHLVFDSNINALDHLWVLLISSGYLKTLSPKYNNTSNKFDCFLQIPNREVMCLYQDIFTVWLQDELGVSDYTPMIQHLLRGEAEYFCIELKDFFKTVISVRDGSKHPTNSQEDIKYEAFYHGFMVGLLGLCLSKMHAVLESNRESGFGYYDLMLVPKDLNHPNYNKAVILEFKRAGKQDNLEKSAEDALNQIINKEYQADIAPNGITEIVFIGIAFHGKHIAFRHASHMPQSSEL